MGQLLKMLNSLVVVVVVVVISLKTPRHFCNVHTPDCDSNSNCVVSTSHSFLSILLFFLFFLLAESLALFLLYSRHKVINETLLLCEKFSVGTQKKKHTKKSHHFGCVSVEKFWIFIWLTWANEQMIIYCSRGFSILIKIAAVSFVTHWHSLGRLLSLSVCVSFSLPKKKQLTY